MKQLTFAEQIFTKLLVIILKVRVPNYEFFYQTCSVYLT